MPAIRKTVQTSTGPVSGVGEDDGLWRYFGIPYAQSPTGPRRFQPPQAVAPWVDVLDCSQFGSAAAQVYDAHESSLEDFGIFNEPGSPQPAWVGSEDCLTLNIWANSPRANLRPVFVWIHGGANWLESSRLSCYDGTCLARRGQMVVVSINYRLGVFGFLDVSGVCGDTYRGSHSNGLRDQLLALQWIKANIAYFGGDPDRITLAGESAGSMNISWLATTGQLHSLVQNVVLMSGVASVIGVGEGPPAGGHSESDGQKQAKKFLDELGFLADGDLLTASTAEILERQASLVSKSDVLFEFDTLFYPRVDFSFTLCNPFEAPARGLYDGVNVMMGHTAYEMGLWLLWDENLDHRDTAYMARKLPHFPSKHAASAVSFYDETFAHETPGTRAMHFLGDACFVMPSMLLAEQLFLRGENVWMYQFDWTGGDTRRRALHAADLGFFFGTLDSAGARLITGVPRDDRDANERSALARTMQDHLIAFVHQGRPQESEGVVWPRFTSAHEVLHFDAPASECRPGEISHRWSWWKNTVYKNCALQAQDGVGVPG